MWILSILFIQVAWTEPPCTVKEALQGCEVFKKNSDKQYIEFADGTKVLNPQFKKSPSNGYGATNGGGNPYVDLTKNFEKIERLNMEIQMDLLFDKSLRGSDAFRTALSSPTNLMAMSMLMPPAQPGAQFFLRLPWPPESPDLNLTPVSGDQFATEYLSKMNPESRAKLFKKLAELKSIQTSMYPGYGGTGGFGSPAVDLEPEEASVRKKYGITPAREKRVSELIEKSRKYLLDEIARGRDPKTLPHDDMVLYKKIQSVEVNPLTDSLDLDHICTTPQGNAFYTPGDHKFTICPNLYMQPDSSLVGIIAHEFAHSIDNCCQHSHHFEVTRNIDPGLIADLTKKGKARNLDMKSYFASWTPALRAKGARQVGYVSRDNAKYVAFLIEEGVIERKIEGIPDNRNPYRPALACVAERAGLRKTSPKEFDEYQREMNRDVRNNLSMEGKVTYLPGSMMAASPHCLSSPLRPSELGEASADIWAAKALGRYLEDNPPKDDMQKFATFAFHMYDMCPSGPQAPRSLDTHPRSRERIESIFLTDARVQKAIGCKGSSKDICLRKIGTQPTGSRPSSPPKAGKTETTQ